MPSRGSSEKITKEKKRQREGEGRETEKRHQEKRSICLGMHSALIALSASRIYTLLRAEPLKKPSFTLPLHETSLSRPRAVFPIVKSRNSEARCALPVAKMDDPSTLDIVEKRFPIHDGESEGADTFVIFPHRLRRIRKHRIESSFSRCSGITSFQHY